MLPHDTEQVWNFLKDQPVESALEPFQVWPPVTLHPANGLRHSLFVAHLQPLAHPPPARRRVLAQPPRQHLLLPGPFRI